MFAPPPSLPGEICGKDVPPEILTAFHDFDVDGNGMIDPLELGQVLKKLDANTFTDESIQLLFSGADSDNNGKIDLTEFMTWMFDPSAKAVREALDKDRMLRMGMILLSIDLPWMKKDVSQASFHLAVLSLRKRSHGSIFDLSEGAETLAAAHALLSVGKAFVPEYAILERQIGSNSTLVKDHVAAPLVYASLAAGCAHLKVANVAWGDCCTEAMEHGLAAGDCSICTLSLAGAIIQQEDMTARILDAIDIDHDSSLTSIDLSNNAVGLEGLQALSDALDRCPGIRNVYLYNIGPWNDGDGSDGDGLGCRRRPDTDDMVLIRSIRRIVKKRKGQFQNEAFHGGDCIMSDDGDDASRRVEPGSKATISRLASNRCESSGVALRTRPADGTLHESGHIPVGQLVMVLSSSRDGLWVNVQADSWRAPLKGWVKRDELELVEV